MDVAVIGAGYVGLVTGIGLAHAGGHSVTFVETDAGRRADLERGMLPINEPGLSDAFVEVRDRVRVAGSIDEAGGPARCGAGRRGHADRRGRRSGPAADRERGVVAGDAAGA